MTDAEPLNRPLLNRPLRERRIDIVVFGVEFFGEPQWQTGNPAKFLAFNLPYVLLPLLVLIRMRKPLPFARRF